MKTKYISILLISFIVFSCSTNDDGGDDNGTDPEEQVYNYFPLSANTYWTYDNESDQGTTRDSMYVAGTEELNGFTYTALGAQEPATSFMVSLLSQSLLRTTDSDLIINGELGAPPIDGFPEITIPLEDVVLYSSTANNGEVLSEITGEILQVVNDIPLIIGYTISTVQEETLENGIDGFTGIRVLVSKIVVNLSVGAEIEIIPGTVLTIPVLQAQDVVVETSYYAEEIGLVLSESLIEYQLEDLSGLGIDLPFPSEDSRTATQIIDTYEIGN